MVVHLARLARQAGYADATRPAALGISDLGLRSALSAALRASEPGFPTYYDDGVLEVFYDSSTVVYVCYPNGTPVYAWQSYTIAADRKSLKLNGDRQEIATGWIPAGPVATPPAPPAPAATPTAAVSHAAPADSRKLKELADFMQRNVSNPASAQGATGPMPYSHPPKIFDMALHARGLPGIGETPAEYSASRASRAARPGPDVAHACLSRSVMAQFSLDDLCLLEEVAPQALAALAAAGRSSAATVRAFAALGQPAPTRADCDLYAMTAARGALDRAKAAQGTASGSAHATPCGCGGHPTASATTPATTTTSGRYSPPKIFDLALAEKGLPPIGGRR